MEELLTEPEEKTEEAEEKKPEAKRSLKKIISYDKKEKRFNIGKFHIKRRTLIILLIIAAVILLWDAVRVQKRKCLRQ